MRVALAASIAVVALGLAACGSGQATQSSPSPTQEDAASKARNTAACVAAIKASTNLVENTQSAAKDPSSATFLGPATEESLKATKAAASSGSGQVQEAITGVVTSFQVMLTTPTQTSATALEASVAELKQACQNY